MIEIESYFNPVDFRQYYAFRVEKRNNLPDACDELTQAFYELNKRLQKPYQVKDILNVQIEGMDYIRIVVITERE